MSLLNAVLNFALITLIAVVIYITIYSNTFSKNEEVWKTRGIRNRYMNGSKYVSKYGTCEEQNKNVMDENHIRQRKVRREIADGTKEILEARKSMEEKYKNKLKEREAEVELEADNEFIISLDSEINKLLASLINIKTNNTHGLEKEPEEVLKLLNFAIVNLKEEVSKKNRIKRGHIKIVLLEEYRDILSQLLYQTPSIQTQ